jgi:hypothetical protein
MTIMPNENGFDNSIFTICAKFIKRFRINKLLRQSNAMKNKGVPAQDIFAFLLGLVFTGKNFYTLMENSQERIYFCKDVVYRFLRNSSINWEIFLFRLSCSVIADVDRLTSEDRRSVLIIDDSPYYRNRSKKVEYLSRCYDHTTGKYYKGFSLLTLSWSDGQTFLPITFRLLGARDDKNLLEESHEKEDNRTLATKRRNEARASKPILVQSMLESVKGTAAEAKYVLFDSWFASPSAILSTTNLGYHVVARLKNFERYHYVYQEENLSISKIFRANKKRRGRSRYLLSVNIEVRHKDFPDNIPAKIVYVRERNNRKNWIALISTDISLSEDEIIALYGKRWDIEPFHKVLKSYLRLEKEFQMRSYDAMTAHVTIVMTRYILLSLENRENKDWRSVNDGYYAFCQELEDISFTVAFELILVILKRCSTEHLHLSKVQVDEFVTYFIAYLPSLIKDKLRLSVCES